MFITNARNEWLFMVMVHMKRLNLTESPIFVILCVLCFQRQNFFDFYLTAKLLKRGYRYHKLRKAFSKFYRLHFDLVSKFNVGLKSLLQQGLLEPEFYGD